MKNAKPYIPPALRFMRIIFSVLGQIFPVITGHWAYRLWFTTRRFKPPQAETMAASTAKQSSIQCNNISVAVYSWGDGPVVLFVHGWTGRGTQVAPFIDSLTADGYRVISFDAPAHGQTPGRNTSIFKFSDVLIELNKQYGDFHAVITHSFGGMATAYAASQGVRFGKMVCFCPPAGLDVLIENFSSMLNIPGKAIAVMKNKLERIYGKEMKQAVSTINNVKQLHCPGLIIHDEDDHDVACSSGQLISQAWENSEFILTHNLGHRRILKDPDCIERVVKFIRHKPTTRPG